jgi:hypothetical protein
MPKSILLQITAHERNILHDLLDILLPFEKATDFVQVEHFLSSGYVLPCIRGLKHHLSKLSSKYHHSFISTLQSLLMESRMNSYETTEIYILAAILDPRFKLL